MNSSRRAVIRELLTEKPFISLKELEEQFPEVSSMTLRRDIEYFEKQGEAIKVRGGARSMKFITTSLEESFNLRLHANSAAKEAIVQRAAAMIEPGRSIFLDSGTTILRLVSAISDKRLTITTSGPNIALELLKKNVLAIAASILAGVAGSALSIFVMSLLFRLEHVYYVSILP